MIFWVIFIWAKATFFFEQLFPLRLARGLDNHQSESIFSTCPYLSQVSAPVLIENLCKERKKTCLLPLSHHLHRSFFFTILTGHIYVPDHVFQIIFPQFHCYYPNHELLVNEKTLMLASTPSCGKFSAKNLEVSFS